MQEGLGLEDSSPDTSSTSSSSESYAAPAHTQSTDKMVTLPQSKINEIVRQTNARVAENVRKSEREKYESQLSSSSQQSASLTPEDIKRIATEAADNRQKEILEYMSNQQRQQEGARIANEFMGKIDNADKSLYPALDSNLKNRDEFNQLMGNMAHVVAIATGMEGTEAIINELLENPLKISSINDLAAKQPALAKKELQKMVDSIKLNQKAANAKLPNQPIARIEPSSSISADLDNGSTTVSDFRKYFKSKRR